MFSHITSCSVRCDLRLSGFFLTVLLTIGFFSSSAVGQILVERTYDAATDSVSVRLSLAVDPNDSIAKGDQDYTLQFGVLLPDGYKVFTGGGWTSISTSNCGYVVDEATGIKTFDIYWHFYLGALVPTGVDLQLCLGITNVYGKIVWEGNLGDVFQRADDGMSNDDRPGINVFPTTVPAFSGGGTTFPLTVGINNSPLIRGFGNFIDLFLRDGPNGIGIKRTHEEPELLDQQEDSEVWRRNVHLYRKSSTATGKFWVSVWFGNLGQIHCPLDLALSGDFLVDDAGPELVTSDWCAKGENPLYLDLYPLWGREATTNIYSNAVIRDATAIDPSRVFFFVDNQICLEDSSFPIGFSEHFKGDCVEGTFRSTIFFRNDINWKHWVEGTTLDLRLLVCDIFGQEVIYDIGEICLYGKTDVDLDCEKPDGLWNLLINNGETITLVDVVDGFNETTVDLWASDVGKGIDTVSLTYRSPSGVSTISAWVTSDKLTEGTLNSGRFVSNVFLGRCIEAGTYSLSQVWIRDKAGNFCSFDNEIKLEKWLATTDGSIQTNVEVVNDKSDIIPPTAAGPLLIQPATADITSGPAVLNVTVDLADAGCGVSFASLALIHCDDPTAQPLSGFLIRMDGNEFMGTYTGTVIVQPGARLGQYAPRLEITDQANNRNVYGAAFSGGFDFEERLPLPDGSTLKVEVVSEIPKPDDSTAPVLLGGEVDCSFDFVEAGGFINLTIAASDPETGIDLGFGGFSSFGRGLNWVELLDSKGMFDQVVPLNLENKDPESDDFNPVFHVQIPLPKGVKAGEYCFRVRLTNKCGLVSTYGFGPGEVPFPEEFPGSCEIINSGPMDCTPPIPIELLVTPGFATVGTDAILSVCLRITDGDGVDFGTGLQSASLELLNGLPSESGSRESLFSTSFEDPAIDERAQEGSTINDVTYKFDIPLTGDQFGGDFLSFRLYLTDCALNARSYDSSICNFNGNYPLPCNLVQIGTDGNDAPIITSDGGGETAAIDVTQNQTGVTTVTAVDSDIPKDTLTFSITGGADMGKFDINPVTGVLTFKTAPDFANPMDANTDNVYEVTVQVDDGNGGTDKQDISVTILELDVNDPPTIVSNGGGEKAEPNPIIVEEGTTAVTDVDATDVDTKPAWNQLAYSIDGGADASKFTIDSTSGVLTFISAPVFAPPGDADGNNIYEVTVKVSDNGDPSLMDTQDICVRVIMEIVDEEDYEAYANNPNGPFPASATAQERAINNDFDGDGQTNGEEFAAGTDPSDPNDFFMSMVGFDTEGNIKIVFKPYLPDKNDYTLLSAFGGPNNDEATSLNIAAQTYEDDPSYGCFIVSPGSGSLQNLFLLVNTTKLSL